MDKEKKVKIRCLNQSCKKWFHIAVSASDMKVRCPSCGKMTDCNKEEIKTAEGDSVLNGKDTF